MDITQINKYYYGSFIMYLNSQYISFFSTTLILWLASFSPINKLSAQTNFPPLPPPSIPAPASNILRDDDQQINQTQLPWLLFSNQRNQTVPLTIRNKISVFLTREGLTPVSCSSNSVVIISVNNIYVACTLPTEKFPPGTYNTNIPNLESVTP